MSDKIPIYCLPGMGASVRIFHRIKLPECFELHLLHWEEPYSQSETLEEYAERVAQKIAHPCPILLGVSFGGIVMQEVAKKLNYRALVLISSVKNRGELPPWFKFFGVLKLYHLLPASVICNEKWYHYFKRGRTLYLTFMQKNTPLYLKWAVKNTFCWQQKETLPRTIHIHGDSDIMFPLKYIHQPIVVKKGTHIMIINRFKWFCEHLPKLLNN